MKIYVKNTKINHISSFLTRITTYNWGSICYNALMLILQWKYIIFRLIFIQKLSLNFIEFQNLWLIKNLISPVRLTLFIKIFYNETLVIKTLVLTIGVTICHKSSKIRLMINHMLLKIQIYREWKKIHKVTNFFHNYKTIKLTKNITENCYASYN